MSFIFFSFNRLKWSNVRSLMITLACQKWRVLMILKYPLPYSLMYMRRKRIPLTKMLINVILRLRFAKLLGCPATNSLTTKNEKRSWWSATNVFLVFSTHFWWLSCCEGKDFWRRRLVQIHIRVAYMHLGFRQGHISINHFIGAFCRGKQSWRFKTHHLTFLLIKRIGWPDIKGSGESFHEEVFDLLFFFLPSQHQRTFLTKLKCIGQISLKPYGSSCIVSSTW